MINDEASNYNGVGHFLETIAEDSQGEVSMSILTDRSRSVLLENAIHTDGPPPSIPHGDTTSEKKAFCWASKQARRQVFVLVAIGVVMVGCAAVVGVRATDSSHGMPQQSPESPTQTPAKQEPTPTSASSPSSITNPPPSNEPVSSGPSHSAAPTTTVPAPFSEPGGTDALDPFLPNGPLCADARNLFRDLTAGVLRDCTWLAARMQDNPVLYESYCETGSGAASTICLATCGLCN